MVTVPTFKSGVTIDDNERMPFVTGLATTTTVTASFGQLFLGHGVRNKFFSSIVVSKKRGDGGGGESE